MIRVLVVGKVVIIIRPWRYAVLTPQASDKRGRQV